MPGRDTNLRYAVVGTQLTTCPSRDTVLRHDLVMTQFYDIPGLERNFTTYLSRGAVLQHALDIKLGMQHITIILHSTLWHSYTADHRGQLIADVINNSDDITPTRVPNTTLQQTSSPDITTVSNTLINRTSWTTQHALSSDHLHIITTITIRHDYRLATQPTNIYKLQGANWTQFTEESAFAQTTIPINIHTFNIILTNIILMADKHNIPKGKMHSKCRLIPDHIV